MGNKTFSENTFTDLKITFQGQGHSEVYRTSDSKRVQQYGWLTQDFGPIMHFSLG